TAEYLIALGEACADLGGDVMVFGSPAQRSLQPGMTREQAYANAADVFRMCLPRLADRGVRICMEPLTPQETDFVNTCADAVELIQMVDQPNFCLHQDVKAMVGAEREPIPVLIERHADILGHFHVNDTNRLGPGMGETDFRPILAALVRVGYSGWVSVEAFDVGPGIEKIARDSFAYMQETLRQVRGA
ncbi:MAG TPA: sugar phosphate isomerase/epimerase, partial [Planctomycetaceae bacterium]|nr:sugar phosphate isomerase/epimerase [Planctomycetaceae bacterium]